MAGSFVRVRFLRARFEFSSKDTKQYVPCEEQNVKGQLGEELPFVAVPRRGTEHQLRGLNYGSSALRTLVDFVPEAESAFTDEANVAGARTSARR